MKRRFIVVCLCNAQLALCSWHCELFTNSSSASVKIRAGLCEAESSCVLSRKDIERQCRGVTDLDSVDGSSATEFKIPYQPGSSNLRDLYHAHPQPLLRFRCLANLETEGRRCEFSTTHDVQETRKVSQGLSALRTRNLASGRRQFKVDCTISRCETSGVRRTIGSAESFDLTAT